jgi:hypothetical protein
MPLAGSIQSFGISEILQLVSHQGKTGTLEIQTGDGVAKLRFRDGNLVEAWPDNRTPAELIGSLLVRSGLISPVQLRQALDRQRQNLSRIGDVLIRMGAIRISEFQEMLALQHRETVYRLLRVKRGRFRFTPEPVELEEGIGTPLDVGSLLMEGFRQIDEWPRLLGKISSERHVFSPVPDAEVSGELTPDEEKVLPLVDGVSTVRQIINRCRMGDFGGWAALTGLFEKGHITPVGMGVAPRVPVVKRSPNAALRLLPDVVVALALVALAFGLVAFSATTGGSPAREVASGLREMRASGVETSQRTRMWEDSFLAAQTDAEHSR